MAQAQPLQGTVYGHVHACALCFSTHHGMSCQRPSSGVPRCILLRGHVAAKMAGAACAAPWSTRAKAGVLPEC